MKKGLLALSTVLYLLIMQSIQAGVAHCPSVLTCDASGNCTTTENTGLTNWTATSFPPHLVGNYGFIWVTVDFFGGSPNCWYANLNDARNGAAVLVSNDHYYAFGPNWITTTANEICPTNDTISFHTYTMPEVCILTTLLPAKK